ncbi:leucine zipper putative tumor suppressor 2 homolog [Lytechinus variegatus]|uniref:leucine zipper putative tumor suppressor 2 homolog n=1 Tax=Lytechinus variegatus TaxID=7654 RepID=UPI001BB214C3|nr:leucine zipper putative tumor suppressor 2 homolog [Lytechinus variegatus]
MAGNAFHMEVLTKSINELQQEKARNEQKLREVRSKRKALTKKFESSAARHNQLEEKISKLNETLKIAQHKVLQSQTELDGQLNSNTMVQAQVQHIEEAIKDTKEQHTKDIEDFEEHLSQMADKFHRSRHFYTDESLLNEIELMKQKAQELDKEVAAVKTESEKKKQHISELQESLKQTKAKQEEQGLLANVQREVMSMLTAENERIENFRLGLLERKEEVDSVLEKLRQWKPPHEVTQEE